MALVYIVEDDPGIREIEEMAPSWTDPFRRIREWQLSKETEDPT